MGCRYDRISDLNWLETAANTGRLVSNNNGARYIALGSNDTVGAYIIQPTIAQQASALQPFVVAAGAPLLVDIKGPFLVKPIYTHVFSATTPLVLDMLVFEELPPVPVEKRAPLFQAVRGAGTGSVPSISCNVRGRRHVTASIRLENVVGAGDNFTVSGYQLASYAGFGSTATNIAVQAGSYAGVVTNKTHNFYPTIGVPAGAYPGNDVLDFVEVSKTTSTEAGIYSVIVQAWD